MKRKYMNIAMEAVMLLSSVALLQQARAAVNQDNVMTKMADGTVIVNTTTLAKDVKGYSSATPLNIHIKNNKVVEGKTVSKARKMKVDTTTGATLSGNAVVENMHRGLDYYTAHK